jgi:hypothetical protein
MRENKIIFVTLVWVILVLTHEGFCQKIYFNQSYKSLTDIDQNNWTPSVEFKKGDTAILLNVSKVDGSYYKISYSSKTMFVYKSVVTEADNYFEEKRKKMDSLNLFIVKKQTKSIKIGDTVKLVNAGPGSMGVPTVRISNGVIEVETTIENLEERPMLKSSVEAMIKRGYDNQSKLDANALADRNKRLKQKFGEANFNRLMKGQIWIGMTEEMFIELKGKPEKINRTVLSTGTSEQWVYGSTYYYFKEGKLTSWQD